MCCSDSYAPFCQERICRTFIVEDEEGNQLRRFQVNVAQFLSGNEVNVSSIFCLMSTKGLSIQGVQYYIPVLRAYFSIRQTPLLVSLDDLSQKKISVVEMSNHASALSEALSDLYEEQPEEQHAMKKQKEPERVIRSVLENVKLWRHLHTRNKKVSLTEAAKLIGISKKTLDDYFLQLRLGELYGFDFKNNLDEKIGVVRAHIRKHEDKSLEANLPKAIRSFELVRDVKELERQVLQESESTRHRQMGSQEDVGSEFNYLRDLI